MKKIVSLFLILCTALSLFACSKIPFLNFGNDAKRTAKIEEIVNNSEPTKIVTKSEFVYGDVNLKSSYITIKDSADGKKSFEFSYQKMSDPASGNPEPVETVEGVYYEDASGKRYGAEFDESEAPGFLRYSLNLNINRFSSYTVDEDLKNFEAKIPANEAVRVFGTDLDAEGDITLKIITSGEYLYQISITYTAARTGATVVINTSYDYSNYTLDFSATPEE